MIVKVQISIVSTTDTARMLIYNESRDIFEESPASEDVLILMAGRLKAFFEANFSGHGGIKLTKEVPDPGW